MVIKFWKYFKNLVLVFLLYKFCIIKFILCLILIKYLLVFIFIIFKDFYRCVSFVGMWKILVRILKFLKVFEDFV